MSSNIHDIAAYILDKYGKMSAIKLQKMIYYCQAWSLVWDKKPLFHEKIKAGPNSPIIEKLCEVAIHGYLPFSSWPSGNSNNLNNKQKETIHAVYRHYGDKSSQWLSDLIHFEEPWKKARKGLYDNQKGRTITHQSMINYYGSLSEDGEIENGRQ